MLTRIKSFLSPENRRLHISIVSLLFLLAFLVCGIVNLAIDKQLSWSLIVLGALVFCWCALFLLLYMKKRPWLWALGSMCALIIPLLFWIEYAGPVKGWVMQLGLPIAGISIGYIALVLLLFRFIKMRVSFKISIAVALMIPVSIVINSLVCRFTGGPFSVLQNMVNSLILVCASLAFLAFGFIRKDIRKNKVHMVEQANSK